MKETNDPNEQNFENTIDILVSPKKSEPETPAAGAPSSTPAVQNAAPKSVSANGQPGKGRTVKDAQETRKIGGGKGVRKVTVSDKAAATRIGKSTPVAEKKAAASAPSRPAEKKGKKETVKPKKARKKALTQEEKQAERASMRSTAMIALIYIAVVVGISAILSFCGIRWANDVFALVKDEVVSTVTIPENATVSEVSTILKENGIIKYPAIFRLYINFKNRDADPPLAFKAGDYEVRSTLNYDQIVSMIKDRRARRIITLTIPEGYTVDEIIDLFVSQGMGTREGFVEAINHFDYHYTFMDKLNQIQLSPNRRYRLEGYLFPATYDFYTDSGEVAIIDKLLAAFDARFENDYYARLEEMGMNLDQVITIASIVQMEGKFSSDFYPISGVFYNRLRSDTMKRLQSDATVQYCLKERKEDLSYADLEVDDPYNTYRYDGLPPSAISNPGWEAIQAALYPESHSHYYFISDTDGSTIFADTEAEHLANKAKLREAKENGTSVD